MTGKLTMNVEPAPRPVVGEVRIGLGADDRIMLGTDLERQPVVSMWRDERCVFSGSVSDLVDQAVREISQ